MKKPLPMGARFLKEDEIDTVDLGPLAGLVGTWSNVSYSPPCSPSECPLGQGMNTVTVPGFQSLGTFIFEIIPYTETLTFSPIVTAGNRGTAVNGMQTNQQIAGVVYEQLITSACTSSQCQTMGFPAGTPIHAETGLFLYIKDCVQNNNDSPPTNTCTGPENIIPQFNIVRMGTVPHGNSILALGSSVVSQPGTDTSFIGPSSTKPTPVSPPANFEAGYFDPFGQPDQYAYFDQSNPNTYLQNTLTTTKANITSMTTLLMSTNNETSGILNIPFADTVVKALDLDATFWIQEVEGLDTLQLQYSQTINLVFQGMSENGLVQMKWPHITVNTLQKVS